MKRKGVKKMIWAILAIVMMSSCKKDLMTYNAQDYIYFNADSAVYSFVYQDSHIQQDTFLVRIALTGRVLDYDRVVDVAVEDSSTAIEGKHFDIVRPIVLQKDSSFVNMKVVLRKHPDLSEASRSVWFTLKDSNGLLAQHFANNAKVLTYKLRFSDKLEKPDWWDYYFFDYEYSETRLKFYVKVMGSVTDPDLFKGQFAYVVYKLKTALLEYNNTHSEPLSDEYGEISWRISWMEY
ncbi:MAG: DUF4843 domain-containing protein [Sphingobacterium sp.]|jgi:hypothetical protein|nr:DUF4843 domain-containing protein [Sphingobacterium sp.]